MTQSKWISSFQLQQILTSLDCEVTVVDDSHVNIYNPQSEKVVTLNSTGHIPPFEIQMIFSTLRLKSSI